MGTVDLGRARPLAGSEGAGPAPAGLRLRPQSMLFTLWGDYLVHQGGEMASRGLVQLGSLFGLSEIALRSALSRMGRAGWLEVDRRGRRSFYRLSPRGAHLIAEGSQRIFKRPRVVWDGRWHCVVYSIPEQHRDLREALRKRLSYIGLGQLPSGIWVSPHNLSGAVAELVDELEVRRYVEQFHGLHLGFADDRCLAAQAWDLAGLSARYRTFRARWLAKRRLAERAQPISDQMAFVNRFRLTHEYRRFFFDDPDLPEALLPERWPGNSAADLFADLHLAWEVGANRFLAELRGAAERDGAGFVEAKAGLTGERGNLQA